MARTPPPRRPLATSPFAPAAEPPQVRYAVGDLVDSDRYGLGRVVEVDVDDADVATSVVVSHGGDQARRFTLPSRTLRLVEG